MSSTFVRGERERERDHQLTRLKQVVFHVQVEAFSPSRASATGRAQVAPNGIQLERFEIPSLEELFDALLKDSLKRKLFEIPLHNKGPMHGHVRCFPFGILERRKGQEKGVCHWRD